MFLQHSQNVLAVQHFQRHLPQVQDRHGSVSQAGDQRHGVENSLVGRGEHQVVAGRGPRGGTDAALGTAHGPPLGAPVLTQPDSGKGGIKNK